MPSQKTAIIEAIFQSRQLIDGQIQNPVVTLSEVGEFIAVYNVKYQPRKPLQRDNPANFIKDFIRVRERANRNWPRKVSDARYTCRQLTGNNRCFEFVRMDEDQIEPFPESQKFTPTEETSRLRVESVSLPITSRRLGRQDEPWLIQVVVRLRVIETHFALKSPVTVVEVDHLQMSVKLHTVEIDALFLLKEDLGGGETNEAIVTCEGKGARDDILEDQIIRQVKAVFELDSITQNVVIPVAVKVISQSLIYVVEFGKVFRAEAKEKIALEIASDCLYEIVPPVPGIGR